jgi:hypothetical protein
MQTDQPSKQFRWVGQPSEEELLGIPVATTRQRKCIAVSAAPKPPARQVVIAPSPTRRLHARDVLTVLAVGAVVWLVLGGAGAGFRFPGSAPAVAEATDRDTGSVVLDREELGSLPRTLPTQTVGASTSEDQKPEDRGSNSGGKNDPAPPGGGDGGGGGSGGGGGDNPTTSPLAQVTLPGVGTVTVEEPDLPRPDTSQIPVPELPVAEDVLPETSTVTLP